jgi:hypothetical protein
MFKPVQIWLEEEGKLRRPLSKKKLSKAEFAEKVRDDVRYVLYVRIDGSYSNGKGGRADWKCSTKKHLRALKRYDA